MARPTRPTEFVRSRAMASLRRGLNQSSTDVEDNAVTPTFPWEDIVRAQAQQLIVNVQQVVDEVRREGCWKRAQPEFQTPKLCPVMVTWHLPPTAPVRNETNCEPSKAMHCQGF